MKSRYKPGFPWQRVSSRRVGMKSLEDLLIENGSFLGQEARRHVIA